MKAGFVAAICVAIVMTCSSAFAQCQCETISQVSYHAPASPISYAVPQTNLQAPQVTYAAPQISCAPTVSYAAYSGSCASDSSQRSSQPRLNNGIIDTPFEKLLFPARAGVRWR